MCCFEFCCVFWYGVFWLEYVWYDEFFGKIIVNMNGIVIVWFVCKEC